MKLLGKASLLVLGTAAVLLAGCGKEAAQEQTAAANTATKSDLKEVKIGLVGEHNEEWQYLQKQLESKGIKLTLVKFADYTLPNRALNDGEIDLNAFQHVAFLKAENEQKGFHNVGIGDTLMAPLGLFSKKIKSVEELKDGDTIAIPNDVTNGGRALKVLELAGLIKLNPEAGYTPGVRDITSNPKHIKIYEVDAGNTPSLLPDVAGAIINNNYCVDNGIDPIKDPIFSDGVGKVDPDNPYINIIAAREADKDNPLYKEVVKAYQTKEVADIIIKYHVGSVPVFKY